MWPEIRQVQERQRHELVLSGPEVAKNIEEGGLDEHVYELPTINFLEISRTSLALLDNRICQLGNLNRLILHYNKLRSLPEGLSKLIKLKFLDVSHNELPELPDIFRTLTDLHSLNASVNSISKVADLSHCIHLTYIDLSHNKLEEIPEKLLSVNLVNLLEIKLNSNELKVINPAIVSLPGLKQLDLSSNKLTILPKELSLCPKLKEVFLQDNPLKDSRLNKLCGQKPAKFKAILDYIQDHCAPTNQPSAAASSKPSGTSGGKGRKKNKGSVSEDHQELVQDVIRIVATGESTPAVMYKSAVQQVRPYIVCCIVRNLQLEDAEKFKKFIAIQTELHEEICDKRTAATIATHDLELIKGNLTYDCKPPKSIRLQPLKRTKDLSAEELMSQLTLEAENLRKEKKRNTYSGIHKYLNLLQDKPLYPFLVDADNTVISFPPITNSDKTKISSATKDVFIEVTSSKSLVICKTVMEKLLLDCLKESVVREAIPDEVGTGEATKEKDSDRTAPKILIVQQVRILDETGGLRVIYPSRVDLNLEGIIVERMNE